MGSKITDKHIKLLNFLYARLNKVYDENALYDYMQEFRSLIDQLQEMAVPEGPQVFMIGQRVIYQEVICTVVPSMTDPLNLEFPYYINNPAKGYVHGVETSNLKPLPNHQL